MALIPKELLIPMTEPLYVRIDPKVIGLLQSYRQFIESGQLHLVTDPLVEMGSTLYQIQNIRFKELKSLVPLGRTRFRHPFPEARH